MREKVLHYSAFAASLLLLASVISGCMNIFGWFDETFSVPTADYEISGKVVNKRAVWIEGIQVIVEGVVSSAEEDGTAGEVYETLDTVYTDSRGRFVSLIRSGLMTSVRISLSDVDGDLNGGYFASETFDIDHIEYESGDGGLYLGVAKIELNDIQLKQAVK